MKKFLRYTLLILLTLVLVVYVGLQFFLGSIVKTGVNQMGPRVTQSPVELGGASISPLSGAGTLTNFSVGNPQGWSAAKALYVGRMDFDVELASLLRDTVVVNELSVDHPEFVYETHLVTSNIGDLMKNIEAAVGTAAPEQQNTRQRKFIVKHFRMQNAKVTIGVGPAAVPLAVPRIDLTDLGVKEGGLTSTQLTFAVMREVMPQIVAATVHAASQLGGTMGAAAGDAVKKAGEGLQKLLGGGKK